MLNTEGKLKHTCKYGIHNLCDRYVNFIKQQYHIHNNSEKVWLFGVVLYHQCFGTRLI